MSSFNMSNPTIAADIGSLIPAGSALEDAVFEYKMSPASPQGITIIPKVLGIGQSEIRLPFHITGPTIFSTASSGAISLLSTGLGGIVDQAALQASNDYLIWGFLDGVNFIGYGATRRPTANVTYDSGSGTFGSTSTFIVNSNNGFLFNQGARVKIRQTADIDAIYNEGVIVGVTSNTIDVELDTDYAVATQSNTGDISGIVAGEMIQLNNFAPKREDNGNLFASYYSYLGSIYVDSLQKIAYARKRGDDIWFETEQLVYSKSQDSAPTHEDLCLARWLPFGIGLKAHVRLQAGGADTGERMKVSQNAGAGNAIQTARDSTAMTTGIDFTADGTITPLISQQSIYVQPTKSGGAVVNTWSVVLKGYSEVAF